MVSALDQMAGSWSAKCNREGAQLRLKDIGSKTYGGASEGVKDDTARTARMIAAALSEYLARRGFIPDSSELKAKRDRRDSFTIPQHPLSR